MNILLKKDPQKNPNFFKDLKPGTIYSCNMKPIRLSELFLIIDGFNRSINLETFDICFYDPNETAYVFDANLIINLT